MKKKTTTFKALRAVACFAFALALVFFPPAVTHAGSGAHGANQVVSQSTDGTVTDHSEGVDTVNSTAHLNCNSVSTTGDDEPSSGQCCNGICLLIVLDEVETLDIEQVGRTQHLRLHEQTKSVEMSGFLRPPQSLI
ncbi:MULTISPECIES: hypothetical protein [Litoreibacter]|uniref:hypothetical protein n=1 Tax=Litoreibacter TaxID=947567 RepID=UPI0009340633|nr:MULTISPECIES: hypothetical protein [Litoreibacter]